MLTLEIIEGNEKGQTYRSTSGFVRLGRGERNELKVTDFHVSTDHAVITQMNGAFVLRDLHSTNGTQVKRHQGHDHVIDVSDEPGRALELKHFDQICLGSETMSVKIKVWLKDESAEQEAEPHVLERKSYTDMMSIQATWTTDAVRIRQLYDAQRVISAALDLDAVMDALAAEAFRFVPRASHVSLFMQRDQKSDEEKAYDVVGVRSKRKDDDHGNKVVRSVVRKVVQERAAIIAADARTELGESASIMSAHLRATIAVPLWRGDEIMGVVQLDNRDAHGLFTDKDLENLALLGYAAAQTVAHTMLYQRIKKVAEELEQESRYLKQKERMPFVFVSDEMKSVVAKVEKVKSSKISVMIEGETGTGKEQLALMIHQRSNRSDHLFVAVNCAAVSESLLESEMFGHKKGAFSGAIADKKGLFELADQGTLFLDEVGEMELGLQAKLLRVLQEGEVRPLGSHTTVHVDVRVLAATHRNLEEEVKAGRFREDLYYRLRVFPISMPALRERRGDVVALTEFFLERYGVQFGNGEVKLSEEARECLQLYTWPGNVRELQNEIQRLVIQSEPGLPIDVQDLSPKIQQVKRYKSQTQTVKGDLKERMDQVERLIIMDVLAEQKGNKSQAAKMLGITREGLHRKLKIWGIP